MRDYTELEGLQNFVLEESWVLGIVVTPGQVEFKIDMVLSRDHPDLLPPRTGDAVYSRVALLRFEGVSSTHWSGQGTPPAVDATGEEDWGAIDSMKWEGNEFLLEGEWGRMLLTASAVSAELIGDI